MAVEATTEGRCGRAGTNHAVFRAWNERLEAISRQLELGDGVDMLAPLAKFVCECADPACLERVDLTLAEFGVLREDPRWFCVAPSQDHVWYDQERVVERHERYWVVEKLGEAARLVVAFDRRRRRLPVPS
jgi:hypothetical protein